VATAAGVAEVGPNYYDFSSCYSFSPTKTIVIQPVIELLGTESEPSSLCS